MARSCRHSKNGSLAGDGALEWAYLAVLQVNRRVDGVEEDAVGTPAELVTQGIVGTLRSRKTTCERAIHLHLKNVHPEFIVVPRILFRYSTAVNFSFYFYSKQTSFRDYFVLQLYFYSLLCKNLVTVGFLINAVAKVG